MSSDFIKLKNRIEEQVLSKFKNAFDKLKTRLPCLPKEYFSERNASNRTMANLASNKKKQNLNRESFRLSRPSSHLVNWIIKEK